MSRSIRPWTRGAFRTASASRARIFARSAALGAAAIGALVLVGWWLRLDVLMRVLPTWPATAPNSALMCFLASASLWMLAPERASPRARIAATLCSVAVLVIVTLSLLEHALEVSFGIDHLLAANEVGAPLHQGRPSEQGSVAWALLAAALLSLDRRLFRRAQVLALASAAISSLAALGYLFAVPTIYGVTELEPTIGMGLPTALATAALSAGILGARPREGIVAIVTSPQQGGVAARRMLLGLLVLVPIALTLQVLARRGLFPESLAAALIVFLGMVLGIGVILRTSYLLNRTGADLSSALADATRWKDLFDRSALGAAVQGATGAILAANPAFGRMHGWLPAELVGRNLTELAVPEERERLDATLVSLKPGEHRRFDSRQRTRSGREILARVEATAVAGPSGEVAYRAIFAHDVTDIRRAQRDRARLASIVESSSDAIAAGTLDGKIFAWNRSAERMFGYSAEEMIGASMVTVAPPELIAEQRAQFAAILSGERVCTYETVRMRRDGTHVPVSLTLSPILERDGRVMGVSAIARDISERVALERELRSREEQYRALFEQAPDGVFVADEGRYTEVNRAGAAMLGYTREQIVGKRIADLLRPEDVERLQKSREAQLAGRVEIGEWELERKDGVILPVEVSARMLPDGRWQGFVRDISDRKRAEAELRLAHETEQRLRRELERVSGATDAVADALASVPESSLKVALKIIALEAQALTGARYAAVGIGDDPDKPFDPWVFVGMSDEQASAIGHPPRPIGTLGIPAREGRTVRTSRLGEHASFRGLPPHHPPMKSYLGVPIHFRGRAVGNIYLAEKTRAEAFDEDDERVVVMLAARTGAAIELARLYDTESLQRTWLQTIFEQMPEAVTIFDERGRILQQNHASQALAVETDRVDLWGNPIVHDLRSPEGAVLPAEELPQYLALVRHTTITGYELAIAVPGGERVAVLASAAPVRTERGGEGAVLVFQDIRPLKELERVREEWASVVAHDLRQPVAVISMAAHFLSLSNGQHSATERRTIERVRSASARLDRMIGDLLDVSRIESRRLSLRRHVVELNALVGRCVDEARELANDRALRVMSESAPVLVWVDPDRIQQALGNLLSNALKYGDPDTEVEVTVRRHAGCAEVAVSNDGCGIPAGELPLLFSRFRRTRETRAGDVPGIGLGLYITKGVVEAHGGHVWVESVVGGRTSFRFTVPALATKQVEITEAPDAE